MGFNQLVAGRINIGSWRAKRHALWATCFMAAIFLVYVQWTSIDNDVSQQVLGHPPDLGASFSEKHFENSRVKKSNDFVNRKVHFINSDGIESSNTNNKKLLSNKEVEESSNVVEGAVAAAPPSGSNKNSKNKNLSTPKKSNTPSLNVPTNGNPKEEYHSHNSNNNYIMNAASQWNGGNFKYNTFGEPVYEHGNRPNYIPAERVVHLDLKGAPPLSSMFKTLIPWLAKYGATALLIEYEDMFPWEGPLASFAAKNHYSKEDVRNILAVCKDHNVKVIPLVQTFGHLEFALKVPEFSDLREIPKLPQAICPSNNDSLKLIHHLIDQTMALHPDSKFLHIGCDEVFQMGECDKCRLRTRESLFLDHVTSTAKYVVNKYNVKPIIWHDMLNHVSESAMKEMHFGELVEPMVWVYAEDIYRFVQPTQWSKFASVFPYVWGASAFKGAFMEQATVPNVRRHLDNNLNWLDVLSSEQHKFTGGVRGLVLTGWQRFDHFAVLCEVFPAAIPSLAINLIATSRGFFNATVHNELYESLQCMQAPKYQTGLSLDADPFLWDKFSWCFFPGSLVFKATARLDSARKDIKTYVDRVTLSRGWISDYNRRHNFSSPMRVDEDLEELPGKLHTVTLLLKTAKEALSEWFDEYTTGEWIEQHIWPLLNQLETLQRESLSMKNVKIWPVRPLPLLKELQAFGITEKPLKSISSNKKMVAGSGKVVGQGSQPRSPNDYFEKRQNYV